MFYITLKGGSYNTNFKFSNTCNSVPIAFFKYHCNLNFSNVERRRIIKKIVVDGTA